jgi:hypothetical protein
VLAGLTSGFQPDPADAEQLRTSAADQELPVEKLVLSIIERYRNKAVAPP